MKISIVVNSCDENRYNEFKSSFLDRIGIPDIEVIRIDNARSMAEGYNRGGRISTGEWILFCHDDLSIITRIDPALHYAMKVSDVFGVCGSTKISSGNWYDSGFSYNSGAVVVPKTVGVCSDYVLEIFGRNANRITTGIKLLDGLFIACKRNVFDKLGGFDEENITGFHTYDMDFSIRAYLQGFKVVSSNEIVFLHKSIVSQFSCSKIHAWVEGQTWFVDKYQKHVDKDIVSDRTHICIDFNGFANLINFLDSYLTQTERSNIISRFSSKYITTVR